jgi:lipopolysaccharide transport system permease protein
VLVKGLHSVTTADTQDVNDATFSSSVKSGGTGGFEELVDGAYKWRVWHLLGVRELRHRYARSKLGQLWLTLSTAIMIGALGSVWSLLWHQPVRELMPFFGIGLIMWTYMAQVLIECTAVFISHSNLYRNQKMNFSVSVYSVIYKNTLMLTHSLIIVVVLILAFGVPINWYQLQLIPAFALTWITMVWLGYIIAMICVRYRDIIQVITNWLLVLFFITPVMWKPEFLPVKYHFIVDYNPLAQFLDLLRKPFLGEPVSFYTWVATIAIAVGGGIVALPLIGRYRQRVIFWM